MTDHAEAKTGTKPERWRPVPGYPDWETSDSGEAVRRRRELPADLRDARLAAIESAIRDYYFALDSREHGGLTQNEAFDLIQRIMGLHWRRGSEAALRRKVASASKAPAGRKATKKGKGTKDE